MNTVGALRTCDAGTAIEPQMHGDNNTDAKHVFLENVQNRWPCSKFVQLSVVHR